MRNLFLASAGFLAVSSLAISSAAAQQNVATDITNAQIQKVLKSGSKSVDNTLRVLDLGSYQLSVAVVERGPTRRPGTPAPAGPAPAKTASCGLSALPAGAKPGVASGIVHDDTTETYVIIAGSGTMITGGQILDGHRSAPDSEVTRILNGPSCSGKIVGNYVVRKMNVGDVSVIPAGVPHGWTDIPKGVTYLSIRPDPKKVLEHGYVNPALK